jgi:hypothetical protein
MKSMLEVSVQDWLGFRALQGHIRVAPHFAHCAPIYDSEK